MSEGDSASGAWIEIFSMPAAYLDPFLDLPANESCGVDEGVSWRSFEDRARFGSWHCNQRANLGDDGRITIYVPQEPLMHLRIAVHGEVPDSDTEPCPRRYWSVPRELEFNVTADERLSIAFTIYCWAPKM